MSPKHDAIDGACSASSRRHPRRAGANPVGVSFGKDPRFEGGGLAAASWICGDPFKAEGPEFPQVFGRADGTQRTVRPYAQLSHKLLRRSVSFAERQKQNREWWDEHILLFG